MHNKLLATLKYEFFLPLCAQSEGDLLLILQLEYEENQELFIPMLMCVTGEFGLGQGVVVWVFSFHRHLFTVS